MTAFYKGIRAINLKVGLFSLAIIVLFVVSYAWLTNRLNNQNQQEISILFDDVGGLEIGDKTSYRGMEVGRVKNVRFSPEGILATIRVNNSLVLPSDTVFYVSDSSLMGGKQLVIEAGTASELMDTSAIQKGISRPDIIAAVGKAAAAIDEFQEILISLNREDGILAKTSDVIDAAGNSLSKADQKVEQLDRRISQTITLVDRTIANINSLVQENNAPLSSAIAKTPLLIDNISAGMDSLMLLSGELNRSLARINKGGGTAGKLLNEEELYYKLMGSIENLDKLIADIKANPRKYIKFSIF